MAEIPGDSRGAPDPGSRGDLGAADGTGNGG
jgi:hypothetical protein